MMMMTTMTTMIMTMTMIMKMMTMMTMTIIILTEHLMLRSKMQANSKAHAFLLPIILALKKMSFQPFLEGREKN